MGILTIWGIAALVILAYMTVIWIASLAKRDASIVDVFWGLGFVVAGWVYFALTDGYVGRGAAGEDPGGDEAPVQGVRGADERFRAPAAAQEEGGINKWKRIGGVECRFW